MKQTLIIMSFLSTIFGTKPNQNNGITVLSAEEFKAAITNNNVQLVDVRTSNEFNSGHIKNAVNIDFFKASGFLKAFEQFDTTKPIYLYCRSGNRSNKAANRIAKLGFTKIYDLQGGYLNYNN